MTLCRTIAGYRAVIAGFRASGESVGLVTTMGALHAGHMALVAAARAKHDRVVATIFVNPTQFGNPADLEQYPRNEEADLEMFRSAGVDAVLIPAVGEIYPEGDETIVETVQLANAFHGLVRPGHFRGVATVVTKLFNIAQPDAAYFGEKDYQQLAVIRRMARDLHMPLAVVGVPTVREKDGLAMSSRNVRLTPECRAAAPVLHASLKAAEVRVKGGARVDEVREKDGLAMSSRNVRLTPGDRAAAPVLHASLKAAEVRVKGGARVDEVRETIRRVIETEPRAVPKGLDIVWVDTFAPAEGAVDRTIGIMLSAEFGEVLLIDQKEVSP